MIFFSEQCYNSALHVWIIAVNAKQMDQIIPTKYIYGIN